MSGLENMVGLGEALAEVDETESIKARVQTIIDKKWGEGVVYNIPITRGEPCAILFLQEAKEGTAAAGGEGLSQTEAWIEGIFAEQRLADFLVIDADLSKITERGKTASASTNSKTQKKFVRALIEEFKPTYVAYVSGVAQSVQTVLEKLQDQSIVSQQVSHPSLTNTGGRAAFVREFGAGWDLADLARHRPWETVADEVHGWGTNFNRYFRAALTTGGRRKKTKLTTAYTTLCPPYLVLKGRSVSNKTNEFAVWFNGQVDNDQRIKITKEKAWYVSVD